MAIARTVSTLLLVLILVAVVGCTTADEVPDALIGEWIQVAEVGRGGDERSISETNAQTLVLRDDRTGSYLGEEIRWRGRGDDRISITPTGEGSQETNVSLRYLLDGDRLVLNHTVVLERVDSGE